MDINVAAERGELHHSQPLEIEPERWDTAVPRVAFAVGRRIHSTGGQIKLTDAGENSR